METLDKLKILSEDSKYDLSCACGTNDQDRRQRGVNGKWLYPVTLPSGGKSILLKTLLTNACMNDCKYCPLRSETNVRRCALTPEETARTFMDYLHTTEGLFGLFLSSGIVGSPDHTMQKLVDTAHILRRKHQFRGFIHLKVIPGASDAAIESAMSVASAVSLNIEAPGERHFQKLSQRKNYLADIIRPLKLMGKLTGKGEKYAKIGTTTQFIVGASDETDAEIVQYLAGLYDRLHFDRIYFSAYQRGLGAADIPGEKPDGLPADARFKREHRLYQVDFLLRKYGFTEKDISFDADRNLSLEKDPKQLWAEQHPEFFPVRLNTAEREALLRVPGLGPQSVNRILKMRRCGRINRLEDAGLKGKRLRQAGRYVTC